MNNKKNLIIFGITTIVITLSFVSFILMLFRTNSQDKVCMVTNTNASNKLEEIFTCLKEEKKVNLSQYFYSSPEISYIDIHLVPYPISYKLRTLKLPSDEIINLLDQDQIEVYTTQFNKFIDDLKSKNINYKELKSDNDIYKNEFKHGYYELFNNYRGSDPAVINFSDYELNNDVEIHDIVRIQISKSNLVELKKTNLINNSITITINDLTTDKNWSDIYNAQVITSTNERDKYAIFYMLDDSYGYKKTGVVQKYYYKDGEFYAEPKRIYDMVHVDNLQNWINSLKVELSY